MPKDPVCGMGVEEGKAQYRSQFRGKTYHFCTARCKEFFERNPVRYGDRRKIFETAGSPLIYP